MTVENVIDYFTEYYYRYMWLLYIIF
jgi:hypothetical protein